MRRLLFLVPILFTACAPISQEPPNLSDLKTKVSAYADSEAYQQDLRNSVAGASDYLIARSKTSPGKLAVVFDIDETVLSNLPHMKKADWGYQSAEWDKWVAKAEAPALAPIREVYQTAIAQNLAVIFLTGRTEADRAATARNLKREGMGTYERLVLRPYKGTAPYEKAVTFKTQVRKELTEEGFTIIANFGDQQSDLEGGYSERTYKQPNPFYKIP